MKKQLVLILVFGLWATISFGQSRQEDTTNTYVPIIPTEKQNRLKNIDMIMNMYYNFRNDFRDGEYLGSKFKFEQFRFEIKGYVSEKVFFRFRHRYTSDFEPQSIDKIIKGVDFAYVRIDLGEKTQLTIGKTFADWGGWEFDINPVEIYEYSDIIEMADNFLSGVGIYHQLTPNHGLSFQVLDSRTGTFEELYPNDTNITPSKAPLAGVLNWRGKLFGGKVTTLWSYSLFTEAEGFYKNYIALGQQFHSKKFRIAYDYKLSMEDLDRTGIISGEVSDILPFSVRNTVYSSHWTRTTYELSDKWHLSLDAFIDFADLNNSDYEAAFGSRRYRTVYSAIPTIEFYPWSDVNFKFFAGLVYRSYVYPDYIKNAPSLMKQDFTTSRVIVGFISPLNIL